MKQLTLATAGFERYGKTTRRAVFLAEMERVVPWPALCVHRAPPPAALRIGLMWDPQPGRQTTQAPQCATKTNPLPPPSSHDEIAMPFIHTQPLIQTFPSFAFIWVQLLTIVLWLTPIVSATFARVQPSPKSCKTSRSRRDSSFIGSDGLRIFNRASS